MNTLLIILAVLIALLFGLLRLRLRLRCYLNRDEKSLFAGLGRSGIMIDLISKTGQLRLFGFGIRSFPLEKEKLAKKRATKPTRKKITPKAEQPEKERPIRDILSVAKMSFQPVWIYIVSLFRAARIEELNANIKAGFESPDLTGQTYGYYHALVGVVPAFSGRLNYTPDWEGSSFQAELKASLAMPLYSLVGRTIQLAYRLPLRKIINLAIGKKKVGNPNGQ